MSASLRWRAAWETAHCVAVRLKWTGFSGAGQGLGSQDPSLCRRLKEQEGDAGWVESSCSPRGQLPGRQLRWLTQAQPDWLLRLQAQAASEPPSGAHRPRGTGRYPGVSSAFLLWHLLQRPAPERAVLLVHPKSLCHHPHCLFMLCFTCLIFFRAFIASESVASAGLCTHWGFSRMSARRRGGQAQTCTALAPVLGRAPGLPVCVEG